MEEDLRPRLIPVPAAQGERRALRGFGAGLGLILFFFAWRGRAHGRPDVLVLLGGLSLALAAFRPRFFGPLFRAWMPVVGVIARLNLWLLCGVLYYLVVTPWGLLLRALGLRPLEPAAPAGGGYWIVKPARDPAESARRIF